MSVPLSVLDLVPIGTGGSARDALRRSVELAQLAERLGFVRYWFAEHHGMPGIASSSPEILIEHIASATSRIRVGSGGIMLPNHAPLRIAEAFHTLETLHPGRIDIGVGRAPGTDPVTSRAMHPFDAEQFPAQLQELIGLSRGTLPPDHPFRTVRVIPGRRRAAADLDPRVERRQRPLRRLARRRLFVRAPFQPGAARAGRAGLPRELQALGAVP